jgi:uncharacterized protein YdaU (DUF1376 family)
MAKDPAFLFYPNDYMGGTMGMTFEEKGAYMDLLILQFNKGAFTTQQAKKILNGQFEQLWPVLIEKFTEHDDKFFNERLEIEKSKRSAFTQSRRNNRSKKTPEKTHDASYDTTYEKHMTQHMSPHMENENENRNKDINEVKGGVGEKPSDLPAPILEAAELNQYTHTKNRNTAFVKESWVLFLTERANDPPAKKEQYRKPQDLYQYFLNWIRNKFPKDGTNKKHFGKPLPHKVGVGGFGSL